MQLEDQLVTSKVVLCVTYFFDAIPSSAHRTSENDTLPTSHGTHTGAIDMTGGFQIFFIFTPKVGEMIQFDEHIFQRDWFDQQLR